MSCVFPSVGTGGPGEDGPADGGVGVDTEEADQNGCEQGAAERVDVVGRGSHGPDPASTVASGVPRHQAPLDLSPFFQDSLVKAHVWTAVEDSDCWVSSAPFVVDAAVSSSPLDLLVSLRPPVTGVVVQRWFAAPLHAHWMMAAPARVELASTSAQAALHVLQGVRAIGVGRDVPLLVVTAVPESADQLRALGRRVRRHVDRLSAGGNPVDPGRRSCRLDACRGRLVGAPVGYAVGRDGVAEVVTPARIRRFGSVVTLGASIAE